MASCKRKTTKDGKVFYEIRVRTGRNGSTHSMRWTPEDTWSERTIQKNLAKAAADFENQVKSGEHLTRQEQKALEEEQRAAEARIVTVSKFFHDSFIPRERDLNGVAKTTLSVYNREFKYYIEPYIGSMKITEVKKSHIYDMLTALRRQGLKTSTINHARKIAVIVFNVAIALEMLEFNPVLLVKALEPAKEESIPAPDELAYTADEMYAIMDSIDDEPLLTRALIHAAADTGCRRGELLALQWNVIDFQTGAARISRNWVQTPEDGSFLSTPKKQRNRTVYLSQETLQLFNQIRAEQMAAHAITPFVFAELSDENMLPLNPDAWSQRVHRLAAKIDRSDFHLHKERHTFCSVSIESGVDPVSVAVLAGHSSPKMTLDTYSHASKKGLERAIKTYRAAMAEGAAMAAGAEKDGNV